MSQPSLLRRALEQVHLHAGQEASMRLAARYDAEGAGTHEQIVDAIVESVDDDLDQVVLETGAWGLPIWQQVIEALGGPPPDGAEQALRILVSLLETPETITATNPLEEVTTLQHSSLDEDDEEPTGYPAREDLSTDAVLPWTRVKLTNFQRRAARSAFECLYRDKHRNALLCLPEGGGRTRTGADIVLGACVAKGFRAVWIRSSRVLLDQVQEEIRELAWLVGELGTRPAVFSISRLGSQYRDITGDVVLTSPGALAKTGLGLEEIEQHGPISLICIDDASMVADPKVWGVLNSILRPRVSVLGLTGAPFDASDPEGRAIMSVFSRGLVFQLSFRDLVDAQHLARPVFIRKKLGFSQKIALSNTDVHWALRGRKDFSGAFLRVMVQAEDRNREILGHWLDHRERYGPTLVFAYDRAHAEAMSLWLTEHDVPNDPIYPGMASAKRHQRLERFRHAKSEVLILAGLLTEGEHLTEAQTIVLARPTLSPVLYKHMVGHGARRPGGKKKLKKNIFYVVDCIDDLEEFGISLAGRSAAIDLGTDFEDTTTIIVPSEIEKHHQRRNKALVSARAWQVLRRFADDQYSVWGELVWRMPTGEEKSVIVFHEGIARLQSAVELVEKAIRTREILSLRDLGKELDWLGAVREVDWQNMLSDCAETGEPPTLNKADPANIPASVEASSRILAQLVEEMLSGRMTSHVAMQHCDSLLADSEPLQDQFVSVTELREELLKLYRDAASRLEFAPVPAGEDRRELIDAFVRFTVGIAMADRVLHEAEAQAIIKAMARLFDLTTEEQVKWIVDAVEVYRAEPLDLVETAGRLRAQGSRAEIYHMYDWLFRVAFADGVFVPEERLLLHEAALALGIPMDEVNELEVRYTATLLQSSVSLASTSSSFMVPMPRFRYCTQCGYPRQLGADFCVSCGSELPSIDLME